MATPTHPSPAPGAGEMTTESPVSSGIYVFTFPRDYRDQPLAYRLIKEFDLMVNIHHAYVRPSEHGRMVLELSGASEDLERGLRYARAGGATVRPLADFVSWDEDVCIHCTACTSQCPTAALSVDRESWQVKFDAGKCIACGQCVQVCMPGAMTVEFE